MNLNAIRKLLKDAARARKLWEDQATPEIREFFKRQHDAFAAGDRSARIAEGLPHFYAAMELGETGLLKLLEKDLLKLREKAKRSVSPDGEIEGDGKFQVHDLEWVMAFLVFLDSLEKGKYENLSIPEPQPDYAPVVIGNEASLAILGDWGTGYWKGDDTPAAQVAKVVSGENESASPDRPEPDIVIHLGDVYYYGSAEELEKNLVKIIPNGTSGTYNLNSNHDMYSAAELYFEAVKKAPFGKQGGTSYFSFSNDYWIVVGLDTAYLSSFLNGFLYGSLGKLHPLTGELIPNNQTKFLAEMALKADADNKKLIIMCHHNAYDGPGMTKETPLQYNGKSTLWEQIHSLIAPYLKNNKAYWYWGHAHCAYTLNGKDNIHARCVGHSAVPWGKGSDFYTGADSNIEWFEDTQMPDDPPLLINGLMTVTLSGPDITENFYTQTGEITYTAVNGLKMKPV